MRDKLINVGQKSFINLDELEVVVSAGADKVKRYLDKHKIEKDSDRVVNLTSDKETRSMILMKTGKIILSSVNSVSLAKRVNTCAGQSDDDS